ncbi:MAG: hypothetical protein V3576_03395 [Candidatus Cloacimonadota bacterium]
MKKLLLLLVILAILSLSACSRNRLSADASRLREELARWESFRSEGIVRANYMGLELRKYYLAQKNGNQMRLDVLDGGILGAGAAPLVSVYVGEYFALESPMMPQLELLATSGMLPDNPGDMLGSLDSLITLYEDEIIRNKVVVHDSVQVSFSPRLQVQEVKDLRSAMQMSISYDSSGEPDQIDLRLDRGIALSLLVDRMSYGPQVFEPLPRPNPTNMDLLRLFQQQLEELSQ